jgi:hypothetical protein
MTLIRKSALVSVTAGVVAGILAGCGGQDDSGPGGMTSSTPPPPPPSMTNTAIEVTTAEFLLTYAREPSETASPLAVNDGAFAITDTSETTLPITVDTN